MLTYDKERQTLIQMENGIRAMNIACLNPDSTKEEQMQMYIIKNLTRSKIHIAAIQETHITQDKDNILGNYRITNAASAKQEETGVVQGGAEIMINESTKQYITQITRQSSRILKVTIDNQHSNMHIQIISTYAPKNGHAEEDRRQHWGEVREIPNKTCKRHMTIWCADANGQLGIDKKRR